MPIVGDPYIGRGFFGGGPLVVTLGVPFIYSAAGKANNTPINGQPSDNGSAYPNWVDADGTGGGTGDHIRTYSTGLIQGNVGTTPVANYMCTTNVGIPATGVETWASLVIPAANGTTSAGGWGTTTAGGIADWVTSGGGAAQNAHIRWTLISNVFRMNIVDNTNTVVGGNVAQVQGTQWIGEGDTFQRVYWNDGTTDWCRCYPNGRLASIGSASTTDINITAFVTANSPAGFARSGRYGFQGGLASAANQGIRAISYGNQTDALLRLRWTAKTLQVQTDGSIRASFYVEWTGSEPAAGDMFYSVFDGVTRVQIGVEQPWQDFASDVPNKTITGRSLPLSAPPITGVYYVVTRKNLAGGATVSARSRLTFPGNVFINFSQSLGQQMLSNGISPTSPSNTWYNFTGNGTDAGTPQQARMATGPNSNIAGSAMNQFGSQMGTAFGNVNWTIGRGGQGGEIAYDRSNYPPFWGRYVDCVQAIGNDFKWLVFIDGQYEVAGPVNQQGSPYTTNDEAVTDYPNVINNTLSGSPPGVVDKLEAITGRTIKAMMLEVGGINPNGVPGVVNDNRMERMRLLQQKLCVDFPSRYYRGPTTTDLQHSSTGGIPDTYHLTPASYNLQLRRIGMAIQKEAGLSTYDLNGPFIVSVARTSATQITAVINLNGATNLGPINTVTNFNGGFQFDDASNFAGTRYMATAVTVDQTTGGTTKNVVFDFGVTLAAAVYCRFGHGYAPFGADSAGVYSTTVVNDLANLASILQGIYPAPDTANPVACQPIRDAGSTISYKIAT